MCGIIGCVTSGEAAPVLLRGLAALEYRGYDSLGIAVTTEAGGVARLRSVDRLQGLRDRIADYRGPRLTGTGVGHTRWATHGGVTEANAHPHADCTGRVSLVHNGIIDNADVLRAELADDDHVFASEGDSEVIAHLVERHLALGEDLIDAVRLAVERLEGSWAIVVLDTTSGRLVAANHKAPLVRARSDHGWFVASDIRAVAPWVDAFHVLEDGTVMEIGPDGTVLVEETASPIPAHWNDDEPERLGHPDYMSKEIDEQPEVAARILDAVAGRIASGLLWRDLGLAPFTGVAIVGCGTSLNAGGVIASALRRFGGVPAQTIIASEASEAVLRPGTLVIAISQSGETADVLAAIDEPGLAGLPLLALTNATYSTLARRADAVVDCSAGQEIGVAATKTFIAQVLTGAAITLSALSDSGRMARSRAVTVGEDLLRMPDLLAQALSVGKHTIPALIPDLLGQSGFLFLGRGTGVEYAAEGALKLKELTYRWAEHYPAGELKHGPLALVESGTPVVVVDCDDPRIAGNIAEVAARGGRIIGIGGSGAAIPAIGRSLHAPRPDGFKPCGPLESVVPMQLLARELAVALGLDVDKPRNLAKSVTVS
ncbi:glutamine--fructose-6-phosphate transaminase (isomerizing) [uncultured Amnibacterium sp.]|uniref:glutamine--fructose-6-phosphate transaminase (isomerizing) n=1 Tax=uncultured Amnibacterium sp. TaxID=1631851 RepID=UPI0035CB4E73